MSAACRSRLPPLTAVGEGKATIQVTPTPATGVRLVHLLELREALAEAFVVAGRPARRWTDAAPRAGSTPVRAAHLSELCAAVVDLD